MIKEYILAIILGAILGLGSTGAYVALCKNKKTPALEETITKTIENKDNESVSASITPTTIETKTSIKITSPENNSVLSTSKINIKGDAKPESLVIIVTPSSKVFQDKANSNGVFNISIELDSGINLLKISSTDINDIQEETELTLTYSTAKI